MTTGNSPDRVLPWLLRTGVAMCFIGHGAFGLMTKQAWVPYFGVAGIAEPRAWQLMPWIGGMDVAIGFLAFIWPCRALFLWAAGWAVWTALLRPFAGQGWPEFFERAGNYGVPLAFLCLVGPGRSLTDWFSFRPAPPLTVERAATIGWILRVTTALLLIGHGGFAFAMGKNWASYATAVGVSPAAVAAHPLSPMAGWFECALGLLILAHPMRAVLLFIFVWKLASEAFRPLAGEPIWEFVERAGSYGAPLALAWLQSGARHRSCGDERVIGGGLRQTRRLGYFSGENDGNRFCFQSNWLHATFIRSAMPWNLWEPSRWAVISSSSEPNCAR